MMNLLFKVDALAYSIRGANSLEESVRLGQAWEKSSRRSARDKAKVAAEASKLDDEVHGGKGQDDVGAFDSDGKDDAEGGGDGGIKLRRIMRGGRNLRMKATLTRLTTPVRTKTTGVESAAGPVRFSRKVASG
jgi:hypothetical protein